MEKLNGSYTNIQPMEISEYLFVDGVGEVGKTLQTNLVLSKRQKSKFLAVEMKYLRKR